MKLTVPRSGRPAFFVLDPAWADQFPVTGETSVSVSVSVGPIQNGEPAGNALPSELIIAFTVREPQIRALETDPLLVHRDSCVEFFFAAPGAAEYYNLEVNPAGVVLLARGKGRHGRINLSERAANVISFQGSHLGRSPFDEPGYAGGWYVTMRIPPGVLDGFETWGPDVDGMRVNFFKCGDSLRRPHYLAWSVPDSATPDYHRPRDFGLMEFSDS